MDYYPRTQSAPLARQPDTRVKTVGSLLALTWGVQIVNATLGWSLTGLGIHPRTLMGLFGIFLSPFLHLGWAHLMANTTVFLVLASLLMLRGKQQFMAVSLVTMICSGLGVWLTAAPNSVTVGASGIIFGYLGFLLAVGVFEKKLVSLAVGLVVLFLYGGAIWGVLPGAAAVSWQGHLFGFLGGIFAAWLAGTPPTGTTRRSKIV